MGWPTASDYVEALQHPGTCFVQPELKTASILGSKFGIPTPAAAGSYAVVFKLGISGVPWAVKCFVSEVPDQHERYAAISQHLAAAKLPHIVGFEYIPNAIRLSRFPNRTFPILKMEWISGPRLDTYVKDNLYNPSALHNLALKWVEMMRALRGEGIGHGDLQHGNVIVANGSLRLLDYDGMTVPSLIGRRSVESGHRNYQHPARGRLAQQIGADVDNFAAWVILLSLVAVSIDPMLWYRAAAGDENLLFKQQDFEAPEQSEILRALEKTQNQQLNALASAFRFLIQEQDLTKIPPLDGVVLPQITPTVATSGANWIQDHVVTSGTPVSAPTAPLPDSAQDRAARLGRIIAVFLLIACCLAPLLASGMMLGADEVVLALLEPLLLYATMQVVGPGAEKRRILRKRAEVIATIQRMEKNVGGLQDKGTRADEDERKQITAIGADQQAIAQRERIERDRANAELQQTLASLRSQKADVKTREMRELAAELDRLRQAYVVKRLGTRSVESASIEGISLELKRRLSTAGIRTAGDVVDFRVTGYVRKYHAGVGSFVLRSGAPVHVDGIGEKRGKRVVEWARSLASTFARTAPTAIDPMSDARIRRRYEYEANLLTQQEEAAKSRAPIEVQNVVASYRQQQDALSQKVQAVRQQIAIWRGENQRQIRLAQQQVAQTRGELAQLDGELRPYLIFTFGEYLRQVALGRR